MSWLYALDHGQVPGLMHSAAGCLDELRIWLHSSFIEFGSTFLSLLLCCLPQLDAATTRLHRRDGISHTIGSAWCLPYLVHTSSGVVAILLDGKH